MSYSKITVIPNINTHSTSLTNAIVRQEISKLKNNLSPTKITQYFVLVINYN